MVGTKYEYIWREREREREREIAYTYNNDNHQAGDVAARRRYYRWCWCVREPNGWLWRLVYVAKSGTVEAAVVLVVVEEAEEVVEEVELVLVGAVGTAAALA